MMATIIRMPEVLANSTEAALVSWLVAEGEAVSIGQPLAEIETEKAIVEYAAETDGVLVRLLVEPGDSIMVGAPIGVIAAAGEADVDVKGLLAGGDAALAPVQEPQTFAETQEHDQASASKDAADVGDGQGPVQKADDSGRQFASPLVRRLVRERGLDLSGVVGTGPNGRIVRRDLDRIASGATPQPVVAPVPAAAPTTATAPAPPRTGAPFTDIPHTRMRKAIARRLTESKSSVPHFYLVADCRVDALLELRRQVNEASPKKISVNDFVVKAVAAALIEVPAANTIWTDSAARRFDGVDVAIAVSTDGGLLTPVLRGVESMSLLEVSSTIAKLAERARAGRLMQEELEGGSFSVSNLGMFGVDEFSAILNPPQSGILAVGSAKERVIVVDGQVAIGSVMKVTLSADHRVLDGALAAEWLAAFVRKVETPLSILI
jgi:pyruvate dehydrogenase E2 component (dihydrolipoamide acetyltransferase)